MMVGQTRLMLKSMTNCPVFTEKIRKGQVAIVIGEELSLKRQMQKLEPYWGIGTM